MKTFLSIASLIAALVFAGLWLVERQGAAGTRRQLAVLDEKVKQQSERLDAGQRTIDGLKVQRADLSWEVGSLQLQVRALRSATNPPAQSVAQAPAAKGTAAPDAPQAGMGKFYSEMLKNPDMKKLIQQQQKVVMEMMYRPLFKELNLSPEETEGLMAIMQERAVQGMESATTLFGNDPQAREEAVKQMTAEHEKLEQQLKDFLGEERYAKYTDYSQTAGDRMLLNQFTSANSVTEDQTRLLLDAIKEERRSAIAEAGEPEAGNRQARELQALASEEELNKLVQRQERVNGRVLERAKTILAPEQIDAFGKFQASQIEMQRMSMNMARTMFGGGKPDGGTVPPAAKP